MTYFCPRCKEKCVNLLMPIRLWQCVDCQMVVWAVGLLKSDTPFAQIFPDRLVPIESASPTLPPEENAPPCYIVDPVGLSENQISLLAQRIYQLWQTPKCESLAQAIACVKTGLPLKVDWFTAVGTDYRMFD